MLHLRSAIWPRTITDIGSTAFLTVAIPAVFYFELSTVLPACVGAYTVAYYVHAAIATFILANIVTNQLALMLVDPSIRGRHLVAAGGHLQRWRLCAVCETLVPLRTWHCATCGVCVLKRDHHCAFSGCCVGHHNQRYFWWLVVYVFVGTLYASWFNNRFVFGVHAARFWQPLTAVKILFPFAMILLEPTWDQAWLTGYLVCTLGALFSGFLCVYHGQNMLCGAIVHDRGTRPLYDLGRWRNVEMVLGRRWWLTWLSPFVHSELPTDGVNWEQVQAQSSGANKTN